MDDPFCTFTQFAEPMTATLADQSKHARPLSTFAAFQAHFLSAFAAPTQEFAPSLSLRNYLVLTCHQATFVLTGTNVPELDVFWHASEQSNAVAN